MDRKSRNVLALAFTVGFFAIGLSYWQIPYSELSLPNAVLGFGPFAIAALAAFSRVISTTRLWPTTLIVGAAVPAAVLARVIYDTSHDPTSHNLWPLEIVLATGPGVLAALVGALAGGYVAPRSGT
jgi:hypothetical protein